MLLDQCIKLPKKKEKYIPCTALTSAVSGGTPLESTIVEYNKLASRRAWVAISWAKLMAKRIDFKLKKSEDNGIVYYIREGNIKGR